jgi:DnaJ-class molecular chaperone
MKWHPDKNRGKPTEKEATEKFQKISAAYKRLTEASIVPDYMMRGVLIFMPPVSRLIGTSDN